MNLAFLPDRQFTKYVEQVYLSSQHPLMMTPYCREIEKMFWNIFLDCEVSNQQNRVHQIWQSKAKSLQASFISRGTLVHQMPNFLTQKSDSCAQQQADCDCKSAMQKVGKQKYWCRRYKLRTWVRVILEMQFQIS